VAKSPSVWWLMRSKLCLAASNLNFILVYKRGFLREVPFACIR
jgi:hypothetical protein